MFRGDFFRETDLLTTINLLAYKTIRNSIDKYRTAVRQAAQIVVNFKSDKTQGGRLIISCDKAGCLYAKDLRVVKENRSL